MKNKILLYGNLNLNIVDGSSIWLMSLAKLLAKDNNNLIDILLKYPIKDNVLVGDLKEYKNIRLLEAGQYLEQSNTVNESNIKQLIEKIDKLRDYSCIIIRGFSVIKQMVESAVMTKVIPYITDFTHDKNKITNEEKGELRRIYDSTNNMFVQTQQMLEYLKEVLSIDGEKFCVLSPIVFTDNGEINKKPKTIVYAGKIAKAWNIPELLEIMEKLYNVDPEIKLYFIGNKFNSDMTDKKEEILNKLNSMPNIVYFPKLSKEETSEIVKQCTIGYGFRASYLDNDNSLEISVKFLEYCVFKVLPIVRKTKVYKSVLGEGYQLYAENVDECVEKIVSALNGNLEYTQINVEQYSPENIYENIKKVIYNYPMKKVRLLISGHDLKFIKPLIPYFEKEYEVTVQELVEYWDLDFQKSKELLQKADIVWCEWLLLNAQWYSNNVYPHQKLFIRAHRFELYRKYLKVINLKNVTKIITVSYYYYEQFVEQLKAREKITVINNFVDVERFEAEKEEGYKYNIAMIGALPARKGIHRAVELLIKLREVDKRYKLHIPGKKPEEMASTWNVETERKYYENVYKIIQENDLSDAVIWNGWVDTADFLKNIGYVLSLSDAKRPESFHLAPLEGVASGALAMALNWEGIEYIYPDYMIFESSECIKNKIIELNNNEEQYISLQAKGKEFVKQQYNIEKIWNNIYKVVDGA